MREWKVNCIYQVYELKLNSFIWVVVESVADAVT